MNLQTFKASTMAQALSQVKSTMGADAVILHTRTYQQRYWLGIRRQEIVEITAGRDVRTPERTARRGMLSAPAAAYGRPTSAPAAMRSPAENGRQLLDSPAASGVMMLNISMSGRRS